MFLACVPPRLRSLSGGARGAGRWARRVVRRTARTRPIDRCGACPVACCPRAARALRATLPAARRARPVCFIGSCLCRERVDPGVARPRGQKKGISITRHSFGTAGFWLLNVVPVTLPLPCRRPGERAGFPFVYVLFLSCGSDVFLCSFFFFCCACGTSTPSSFKRKEGGGREKRAESFYFRGCCKVMSRLSGSYYRAAHKKK